MKIAIINDTHFGAKNDSPVLLEHFIRFFEWQFFPYCIKNNIQRIIHLGDFFDRRKYINSSRKQNEFDNENEYEKITLSQLETETRLDWQKVAQYLGYAKPSPNDKIVCTSIVTGKQIGRAHV